MRPGRYPLHLFPARPSSCRYSRRSDTIRLTSIISIRSCKPFSFSVCLHISSETAEQTECIVKLASAMLRCSRQCRFHRNLFLCEFHKVYSFFSFVSFCFYKSKKSVDFFIPLSQTHFWEQYLTLEIALPKNGTTITKSIYTSKEEQDIAYLIETDGWLG